MKRMIAALVVALMLIGCLTACSEKKQPRGGEMPEVPNMKVSCGLKSVEALRGGFSWKYEKEEIREDAPNALLRKDETPCLKVAGGKEVKLEFDIEPLEVMVTSFSTDAWGDSTIEGTERFLSGTTFTLEKEDAIYVIWARWQGNDSEGGTLSGNIYYSFYTDVN